MFLTQTQAIQKSDLPFVQKTLLVTVASLIERRSAHSLQDIADAAGCSRTTVKKYIPILKEKGLLIVLNRMDRKRGRKLSNSYRIVTKALPLSEHYSFESPMWRVGREATIKESNNKTTNIPAWQEADLLNVFQEELTDGETKAVRRSIKACKIKEFDRAVEFVREGLRRWRTRNKPLDGERVKRMAIARIEAITGKPLDANDLQEITDTVALYNGNNERSAVRFVVRGFGAYWDKKPVDRVELFRDAVRLIQGEYGKLSPMQRRIIKIKVKQYQGRDMANGLAYVRAGFLMTESYETRAKNKAAEVNRKRKPAVRTIQTTTEKLTDTSWAEDGHSDRSWAESDRGLD